MADPHLAAAIVDKLSWLIRIERRPGMADPHRTEAMDLCWMADPHLAAAVDLL